MEDKIFIVTHKKIEKLIKNKNYDYIQVNTLKNGNLGYKYNDNDGINISEKNPNYCELTALYWIWKNYNCSDKSIIGIMHYRRFLSISRIHLNLFLLSMKRCKNDLKKYDMLVPKKFHFPVTTYEYYYKCEGKKKDLDLVKTIISNKFPDYISAFETFCNSKEGHYCNMMICKKGLFDKYCEWLFEILFELEKRVDLSDYTVSEARIFGYLSELLLNVYIIKNTLKVKDYYIDNTERRICSRLKKKIGAK